MLVLSRISGEILDFYHEDGTHMYSLEFECHRKPQASHIHRALVRTVDSVEGECSNIELDLDIELYEWLPLDTSNQLSIKPVDSYQPRAQVCLDIATDTKVIRREILEEVGVSHWDFSR